MSYRRPLSGSEALYVAGARLQPPFAIEMLVEGRGEVSREDLQRGVEVAAEATPGCRLRLHRTGWRTHAWIDSGVAPPVVVLNRAWHGDDFAHAPFAHRNLDLYRGPTCEVLQLLGAADGQGGQDRRARLVFRAAHAVMDARGVQLWVRNVFRALRSEGPVVAAYAGTDLALARSLGRRDPRPRLAFDCASPAPSAGPAVQVRRRVTLRGGQPALVAKVAVELAAAVRGAQPASIVRWMVPVDLRPHLPANLAGTGNLSLPLFISPREGQTWTEVHQDLLAALEARDETRVGRMDARLARTPLGALRLGMAAADRWQTRSGRFAITGVLSNLGRMRLAEISAPGFAATSVSVLPFDIPLVPLSMVAVQTQRHAELSFSLRGDQRGAEVIDALIARIERSLSPDAGHPPQPRQSASHVHGPDDGPSDRPDAGLGDRPADGRSDEPGDGRSGGPGGGLGDEPGDGPGDGHSDGPGGRREHCVATRPTPPVVEPVALGPLRAPDSTVVARFEQVAAASPSAAAVVSEDATVTYAQLSACVAAWTDALAARGVGEGDRVGLMLDRSVAMVAILLAVLRRGAAYVPLDPLLPQQRLGLIAHDAELALVVVAAPHAARVPEGGRAWVIEPSLPVPPNPRVPASIRPVPLDPCGLAYVMYTSGTTGTPNGVAVEHRQLAHYVSWAARVYADGRPASFPLFTSLGFDLTVTSIFTPLATGGAIHLVPERDATRALQEVFSADRVDAVKMTPSHLRLALVLGAARAPTDTPTNGIHAPIRGWSRTGRRSAPRRLRCLILGGEALPRSLCDEAIRRLGPDLEIFNEYGPTEATVGCMVHRYRPGVDNGSSVPIGTAADHAQILILDARGEPVREGETGELHIAGAGLARGYLNRPELTRQRFVRRGSLGGGRVYRTGDLASRDASGLVTYRGRVDDQVKVGGCRIEPGEVRAALDAIPGILQSAVAAAADAGGEPRLYAYYVVDPSLAPVLDADSVRAALHRVLPAWMVPLRICPVPHIPLTLHGKVDTAQLLDMRAAAADLVPRTGQPVADLRLSTLRSVWEETLGLRSGVVTLEDSFYDCGGDSLLMVGLVQRVREELLDTDAQRSRFRRELGTFIADPRFGRLFELVDRACAPDAASLSTRDRYPGRLGDHGRRPKKTFHFGRS